MPEMERKLIPAFLSETEEAVWWDNHQDLIAQRFMQSAAAGTPGHGRAVRQRGCGSLTIIYRLSNERSSTRLQNPESGLEADKAQPR